MGVVPKGEKSQKKREKVCLGGGKLGKKKFSARGHTELECKKSWGIQRKGLLPWSDIP